METNERQKNINNITKSRKELKNNLIKLEQNNKDYNITYNNVIKVIDKMQLLSLYYDELEKKQNEYNIKILYNIEKIENLKHQRINIFEYFFLKIVTCCCYNEGKRKNKILKKIKNELKKLEEEKEKNNFNLQKLIKYFEKIEIITTQINFIVTDLNQLIIKPKNTSIELLNNILPFFLSEIQKINNENQPSTSGEHNSLITNGCDNNGFEVDLVNEIEGNVLPTNSVSLSST